MKFKRDMSPRVAIAKWIYQVRGNRPESVRDGLFSDPAWDILLDTYVQNAAEKPVSVTSACIASRVPPTTALRWITILEKDGWIGRVDDGADKRRSFIELTALGKAKMDEYLDEILDGLTMLFPAGALAANNKLFDELSVKVDRLLALMGEGQTKGASEELKSIFEFGSMESLKSAISKDDSHCQCPDNDESEPSGV